LTTAFALMLAVAQYFASAGFELIKASEHFDESAAVGDHHRSIAGEGV